jgi:hypothetical protein
LIRVGDREVGEDLAVSGQPPMGWLGEKLVHKARLVSMPRRIASSDDLSLLWRK